MSISTISVRIPAEVQQDLKVFERDEKLLQTSEAARKLLLLGLESWRREKALRLLEQGRVSYSKAAQLAKMNLWEFTELVRERKVVWIKNKALLRKDLDAAQ